MNYIDEHVGKKIKERRLYLDRDIESQATLLGVSAQELEEFENGSARLSAEILWKCCQTLDLTPLDIYRELLSAPETGLSCGLSRGMP